MMSPAAMTMLFCNSSRTVSPVAPQTCRVSEFLYPWWQMGARHVACHGKQQGRVFSAGFRQASVGVASDKGGPRAVTSATFAAPSRLRAVIYFGLRRPLPELPFRRGP